jgi:hypothetical protein
MPCSLAAAVSEPALAKVMKKPKSEGLISLLMIVNQKLILLSIYSRIFKLEIRKVPTAFKYSIQQHAGGKK